MTKNFITFEFQLIESRITPNSLESCWSLAKFNDVSEIYLFIQFILFIPTFILRKCLEKLLKPPSSFAPHYRQF